MYRIAWNQLTILLPSRSYQTFAPSFWLEWLNLLPPFCGAGGSQTNFQSPTQTSVHRWLLAGCSRKLKIRHRRCTLEKSKGQSITLLSSRTKLPGLRLCTTEFSDPATPIVSPSWPYCLSNWILLHRCRQTRPSCTLKSHRRAESRAWPVQEVCFAGLGSSGLRSKEFHSTWWCWVHVASIHYSYLGMNLRPH